MIHVNTGNLRYGASRFSGGAADLRMRAGRLKNAATQLGGRWSGEASRAFFQAVEIVLRDLDKAAGFLEQANTAMNQLAWTMEQVERIRQQIQNLEWELSSLSGEEHQHERSQVRSHIRQLQLQADTESNQADYTAAQAFHRILGDLHSLHFYDPDKSWWANAVDAIKTGGNAVEGFLVGGAESVVESVEGLVESILNFPILLMGIGRLIDEPDQVAREVWAQVQESWDRDVTHGDAYSGGEWFGKSAGNILMAALGGKGAVQAGKAALAGVEFAGATGELGTAAARINPEFMGENANLALFDSSLDWDHYYSSSNLEKLTGPSFHTGLEDLLKRNDLHISPEEFNQLKNKPLDYPGEFTKSEWETMKQIRETFKLSEDTIMQKVISESDLQKYLNGRYTSVQGFVARYQDVKDLSTSAEYRQELRLDYNNPNNPHGPEFYNKDWQNPYLNEDGSFKEGPIYAMRFRASDPDKYYIPYSQSASYLKTNWPCTGDGFLGGEVVRPEFKFEKAQDLEYGNEIYIIREDGTEQLLAKYDGMGNWVQYLQIER